ncbi:MAG: hypothetical protein EOO22_25635, partial [Comamonadaceae bacterium]
MTRSIHAALLVLASLGYSAHAWAQAPHERQWLGDFTLRGQATALVVHEASEAASVDLPALGARGVPLTQWVRDPQGLRFAFEGPPGRFEFKGRETAGRIDGAVVQ